MQSTDETIWLLDKMKIQFSILKRLTAFLFPCGDVGNLVSLLYQLICRHYVSLNNNIHLSLNVFSKFGQFALSHRSQCNLATMASNNSSKRLLKKTSVTVTNIGKSLNFSLLCA